MLPLNQGTSVSHTFDNLPGKYRTFIFHFLNLEDLQRISTTSRKERKFTIFYETLYPFARISSLFHQILNAIQKDNQYKTVSSNILYGLNQCKSFLKPAKKRSYYVGMKRHLINCLAQNLILDVPSRMIHILHPKHILNTETFEAQFLPYGWEDLFPLARDQYLKNVLSTVKLMHKDFIEPSYLEISKAYLDLNFYRQALELSSKIKSKRIYSKFWIHLNIHNGHLLTAWKATLDYEDLNEELLIQTIIMIANHENHHYALTLANKLENVQYQSVAINEIIIDSFDLLFPEKAIFLISNIQSPYPKYQACLSIIKTLLKANPTSSENIELAKDLFSEILTGVEKDKALGHLLHSLIVTRQLSKKSPFYINYSHQLELKEAFDGYESNYNYYWEALIGEKEKNFQQKLNLIHSFRCSPEMKEVIIRDYIYAIMDQYNPLAILELVQTEVADSIAIAPLEYMIAFLVDKKGIQTTLKIILKLKPALQINPAHLFVAYITRYKYDTPKNVKIALEATQKFPEVVKSLCYYNIVRSLARSQEWQRAKKLLIHIKRNKRFSGIVKWVEYMAEKSPPLKKEEAKCLVC